MSAAGLTKSPRSTAMRAAPQEGPSGPSSRSRNVCSAAAQAAERISNNGVPVVPPVAAGMRGKPRRTKAAGASRTMVLVSSGQSS